MPSRRRRHLEHDEEASHERWLVTYADMVTLLMVLFIIMFAMSTVDQKKFAELRNGLADGFGHSINILNGANAMLDDTGAVEREVRSIQPRRLRRCHCNVAHFGMVVERVKSVGSLRLQRSAVFGCRIF